MKLSASTIKALWAEFADCPINDNEEILESFCGWPVFTDREEIWRWFDEQYALYGGVHALMFPEEHRTQRETVCEQPCDTCPRCGEHENVEYGHVYAENGWAWHEVECLECGFRYTLEYEFKVVDLEEA